MDISDLVRHNRSYRRFNQSTPIAIDTLKDLVALARICPSAMNAQPLRYVLCRDPTMNDRIFQTLSWAGSLKDWDGPVPGEQPAAYIVVLSDRAIDHNVAYDAGIACQTILLAAADRGLGGCMLGAVKRAELCAVLDIPDAFTVALVVALGVPAEKVELEVAVSGAPTTYYRDGDGTHHVPKRAIGDIVLGEFR